MKAGVMEIADVLCVNKADHPQSRALVTEVRRMLEIGHELDPEVPVPEIVTTRGDTGEGVEDLKRAIEDHRRYLAENGGLEGRRRASLKELVVAWARGRLEGELRGRLSREDAALMEKVYGRELDPISAAEELLGEV
jgi:LAO/AO transport system kinase